MTHRKTPRLIAAFAALSLTALAACGGSDDPVASGGTVPAPVATVAPGASSSPRAPTPIEFTNGVAGGANVIGMTEMAAADSRIATDMMIAPTYVAGFVVGDGLPALPTDDTGFVYDGTTRTTAEQAAELATLLGVEGEPVRVDDWEPGGWQVGPTDGSGPSLFLSDDAQHTWSYSPAWDSGYDVAVSSPACEPVTLPAPASTDPAVSEPVDAPAVDCATPETYEPTPPEGILTADEATARAHELLARLGVDVAGLTVEPYADEWSASVSAGDQATGRYWSFGFGAEGALQWANGTIGVPAPVGPYPLIDLDTALERLADYQLGAPVPTDLMRSGIDAVIEPAIDVPATDDAPGDVEILPAPVDSYPEPEPITVTLVDVQADFWWAWDADGSMWLVPAYRFIGDDGGWYTIPAVTDEYLIEVPAPEVLVDPMPIDDVPAPEPGTEAGEPPATVTDVSEPEGVPELEDAIGTSIDDFTAAAKELGWNVRVTEIDGQPQPATMDYRTDRINVAVTIGDDGTHTVTAIINVG
ncbi:MAG TPA: hypothetical protein VNQ73_01810 [Ilumatobacter sp.]|nr:hypothetical protein [Ilumatobacter sp.]